MSEPRPPAGGGIALALGGGGARGLAHVGVLGALDQRGIPIAALAGTSMGGLMAALYAAGVPPAEIESQALRLAKPRELLRLVDLGASRAGLLLRGQRVYDLLLELLGGDRDIESLPRPLALTATDLESGRSVVLRRGSLADAVRATISLPGVFQAVEQDGMRLVDGGLLDNVPTDVARDLVARPVVAVDVLPRFAVNVPGEPPKAQRLQPPGVPRFLDDVVAAAQLMLAELTELRRRAAPPALTLRPAIPPEVTLVSGFERTAETIGAGRQAVELAAARLAELATAERWTPGEEA